MSTGVGDGREQGRHGGEHHRTRELAHARAAKIAADRDIREQARTAQRAELDAQLDPDHILTDQQRDALAWQHQQQAQRVEQHAQFPDEVAEPDLAESEPRPQTSASRTRPISSRCGRVWPRASGWCWPWRCSDWGWSARLC